MPGVFADRSGLVSAVAAWDANSTAAEVTHGHISGWDVSRVGDMSGSFANGFLPSSFNGDISNWNTGSVTDLQYMVSATPARSATCRR